MQFFVGTNIFTPTHALYGKLAWPNAFTTEHG